MDLTTYDDRPTHSDAGYYHDLIGTLGAIVWEADPETFQFTFVSPQAEQILGYAPDRWMAKDFWLAILHPDDRERAVRTCLEGLSEGRDTQFEYRVIAADEEERWIYDVVRLVRDGAGVVRQLRGIMVDITERKRAQEERERLRSMIYHDLNNPLAVLLLNADLLLAHGDAATRSDTHGYAHAILRSAEQIQRLMLDLGRDSEPERNRTMNQGAQPAASLLENAASMGRTLALDRGIALEVRPPEAAWVWADPERVQQVFGNLVENAIRYTPTGGVIRLGYQTEPTAVRFFVSDSGAGIPQPKLASLLAGGPSAGAGLGLAITREIVQAHGGTLRAESQPGAGSTFSFDLPRIHR